MTLFLGGPRHGQDVDVPPEPQPLLDIATNQPRRLPLSYVDIATASLYILREVTYVTPHPLTGQPDKAYVQRVYMHETVDPQTAQQLLPDAVLRRWFVTEGTLHEPTASVTP